MTHTRTFAETNIVLDVAGATIWAEDFSHSTVSRAIGNPFRQRAGVFIDADHAHIFATWAEFTEWLHDAGAIVRQCWVLGDTLSDEERQP